jgi:hypothetical protein
VSILAGENFVVQMSITCLDDRKAAKIDVGVPSTSERLRALELLSRAGVKTAIRYQPLIPNHEIAAQELVERAASVGARHVSVEHLKLSIEHRGRDRISLSNAVGFDVERYYAVRGATRVGREWVLPAAERLPTTLKFRELARKSGMSFGAADTDLLHLSDGDVCCSGADLMGLGAAFRFNYLSAVKRGVIAGRVSIKEIEKDWRPTHSVAEFLNSNSRAAGTTVEAFIRARWNGVANGPSPSAFYGVLDMGVLDADGFKIYEISRDVRHLCLDKPNIHRSIPFGHS